MAEAAPPTPASATDSQPQGESRSPIAHLIAGYERFRRNVFPQRRQLFEQLTHGQHPKVMLITCSDSRIEASLLLNTEPGELFVCRNVGNIVPAYGDVVGGVSAAIEYAVAALKVSALVVCGHSDCGAMKALLHPEHVAPMPAVSHWIRYAESARRVVNEVYSDLDETARLEAMIKENVVAQVDNLATHPSVAAQLRRGALVLYGWVYQFEKGEIVSLDPARSRFTPLDGGSLPAVSGSQRRLIDP